jgi:4-hydroxythreonine-4-phosphate dehydrogenase
MGDPSGIGAEVTLKALASPKIKGLADFLIIGDSFVLERTAKILGCKICANILDMANVPEKYFAYGRSSMTFGRASMQYLDMALELIAAGSAEALVTAPVNKASIKSDGFAGFQGHTEYIAEKFGVKNFAMMFFGDGLKAVPVTRHIALKTVAKALTTDLIYRTIELADNFLKEHFRIKRPRIAVCGLNPHAGESGAFGNEEADIIIPAIKRAARSSVNVYGPLPADAVFYDALKKKYDVVIAMYHDQALAPFKMLYFSSGVNLTLGLPFIRTSPDHGTAFNIAGKGAADPGSMIEAIKLACSLQKC